ncbi:MAG: CoA transferase subunit A [Desulfonatronovibrionaceae bacterium]
MNKLTTLDQAVGRIKNGQTIMVGGFGSPGTPMTMLDSLLERGLSDLTIIKNEVNEPGIGISKLVEAGLVKKLIISHLGLNTTVIEMMNRKEVEIEFHPQGILAEKIRAGGAGLPGIISDIGVDTIIARQRQVVEFMGRQVILEPSLRADAALVHCARADTLGNLCYTRTAFNFNPLMAQAADLVLAETFEIADPGGLDPDHIHTPAVFVDHVVSVPFSENLYGVLPHHVLET